MIPAALPENEQQRLEDLYSFNILDTTAERDFDELVELASMICGTPMSTVTLVDRGRQWFKARVGLTAPETPRDEAICAHAILQDGIFVVENTLEDERFFDLPSVLTDPHIRFYAGAPIVSQNGYKLGTVCVIDDRPRQLSEVQQEALLKLARQASLLLEFRKKNAQLKRIAREQLQQKQLAEIASKTQKQFLSTMSHEIRTPLNGIIGMTNLLLTENPRPDQLEYLNSLRFAGDHLLNVVNDILDYNKITGANLTFESIDFNLPQLVQEIGRGHAVNARNKGLLLEVNVEASVPEWVNGDPARLTQVLHNLVGNAVKFTNEGSVQLRVAFKNGSKDGYGIDFAVKDTGIGIAEDKLEKVFEEFGQAHAGINRQFGGTGLGLAISKKLLELQGSEIFLQSAPGEGSCFSFTLIFKKPLRATEAKRVCAPEDSARFSDLRVLVVEDNQLNWVVLRKYLQLWGVEADHAADGALALEKARACNYDIIFMDLQMPVMDGYEATRRLREELAYNGTIFAITADAFVSKEQDLTAIGFTDSVVKPFDRNELCAKINAVHAQSAREKAR
ncbi:hybrid sensor histidine kinase/response regulator [Flaviaesturariibacter flavus]|uniref:histidine kinase n=1 Tax=Flaviaesturariibacter flavus TaxID=2502780 RepID=A0A4R1B1Z8_9BACT|nr:GAF domain-containing hybrid sensor histidine kinase/response regulator [Flaviaesturariibacter flavus]TCJ12062.1 hybrid sensor histidine kinase/response regulator [Flaviaesturariibacter flavus]